MTYEPASQAVAIIYSGKIHKINQKNKQRLSGTPGLIT
jgi:hypothetical protein